MEILKKERDCHYELIRLLACFFVLGVHTMWIIAPDMGIKGLYTRMIDTIFVLCNPIFFMISGKFALNQDDYVDDMQYVRFYIKKIAYLILPLLFYMFLLSAHNLKTETGSYSGLFHRFIVDSISGHSVSHFWFMYVLVGNVLMSPFTSKIFSSISRFGAIIFISILLLTNCAIAYSPYLFSVPFSAWINPFVGWSMYFYLGACVEKIFTDKQSIKLISILGLIGFLIIILKKYEFSYQNHIHDYMPSFTLFSLWIYVWLTRLKFSFSENTAYLIRFFASQSFGIYLIHFPIVFIMQGHFKCPTWCPDILFQYVYIIVIFVISFIFSLIVNTLILKPIQKQCDKLILLTK